MKKNILLSDSSLPDDLRRFLVFENGRGINRSKSWFVPQLSQYKVVGSPPESLSLQRLIDNLSKWVQDGPKIDVLDPEELDKYQEPVDAFIINNGGVRELAKKLGSRAPVLELADREHKPTNGYPHPVYAPDSRTFLKALAQATDVAPVFLISKDQRHAQKTKGFLGKMGSYFTTHAYSLIDFLRAEDERVDRGVAVYIEDPKLNSEKSPNEEPVSKELDEIIARRLPVVYFRPTTMWKTEGDIPELLDKGLFDFIVGDVRDYYGGMPNSTNNHRELMGTLERLINSVDIAFRTKEAFSKEGARKARTQARKLMPHVLVHAPYNDALRLTHEMPLNHGAVTQHTHVRGKLDGKPAADGRLTTIFSEEALAEVQNLAKLWKPNIIYVQLGKAPSEDRRGAKRNLEAFYKLKGQLSNSVIWIGYESDDRELNKVIVHLQRKSPAELIQVDRLPIDPVLWRKMPIAWRKYRDNQKEIEHRAALYEYRDLLNVNPSELEEVLSDQFDFDKEPEAKHVAKPVYPGAVNGRLVNRINEIKKGAIYYCEDLSNLSLDDVRGLRNLYLSEDLVGIIFKQFSYESHHTIDLMRFGVPMIQADDVSIDKGLLKTTYKIGNFRFSAGDDVAFSGSTGKIYQGKQPVLPSRFTSYDDLLKDAHYSTVFRMAEGVLSKSDLEVMINADSPEAIADARKWGANSVGLVRSENVLHSSRENLDAYGKLVLAAISCEKLDADMRENNVAEDQGEIERAKSLVQSAQKVFVDQQYLAFKKILKKAGDTTVQIRLLDPPMDDFFTPNDVERYSKMLEGHYSPGKNVFIDVLKERTIRGAQLLRWPQIYHGQLQALFRACDEVRNEGTRQNLRIFTPYVDRTEQVKQVVKMMRGINENQYNRRLSDIVEQHGVTLETPGGCHCANNMILDNDLRTRNFTFGTNDLFPLVDGSADRDRVGSSYTQHTSAEEKSVPLLSEGVVNLVQNTVEDIEQASGKRKNSDRDVNPDKQSDYNHTIGICGELNEIKLHPRNLGKFLRDISYVSAGRAKQVPMLKLLAAQGYLRSHLNTK